tara:strand:- start:18757 stop:19860 length:1104 start_codon:yes stop_codon:yes gene_type:complete
MKGPIFLAGICERCGKTLLRKILNIHSEVRLAPAETKFMSQMWSRRILAGHLRDSNLPKGVESYLNNSVLKIDKRKELLENLKSGNMKTQEADVELLLDTQLSDIKNIFSKTTKTYGDLHRSILQSFVRSNKSNYGGEKDPTANPFIISLIDNFPQSKIVNLVRDGRGIITSMISTKSRLNILEMSNRVKYSYSLARKYEKKNISSNYYQMFFEKMIRDPKTELTNLCNFIGISFEDEMLHPSLYIPNSDGRKLKQGFDKTMINIWKKKLTLEQILVIEYILKENLTYYGYKVIIEEPEKYIPILDKIYINLYILVNTIEIRLLQISNYFGLGNLLSKPFTIIRKYFKQNPNQFVGSKIFKRMVSSV